ncbi:MAG: THUMP domain-containing protein [Promethearchaeota archaeon]
MSQLHILKQYNLIKINPSPEIWLKSMKVRMRMMKTLTINIKQSLNRATIPFHKYQLSNDSTRLFFFFNNEDIQKAIELLENIFGIDSFSPTLRTSNNLKNIVQRTLEVCEDILVENDTFAIRVKRSGKHDYTSQDVAIKVGKAVLDHFSKLNLKVNLSNPIKRIFIEIRGDFSYIFTDIIKSKWEGLPIEVNKKVCCMDVGRLNDLLAGFLLMRRGCNIYPILFKLTDYNNNLEIWINNWKEILAYIPHVRFKLRIINLLTILRKIWDNLADKKYLCVMCRLLRFEIISRVLIGLQIEDFRRIEAITDGISLNNLTLCPDIIDFESISINYVFSKYPIFTPLIALESDEINETTTKISKNFNTLDYCFFKPQNQEIHKERVLEIYNSLELENLISEAIKNMEEINIT